MNESDRPQVDVRFLQRRRLLIGAGALLSGCAEPYIVPGSGASEGPQPVATLEVHGRVEVVQGGRLLTADDGMPIFAGDDIRTFASSYAQCRFANGNRVWLDHETRVRMGSIFTLFGRVFASVSGLFEVDSEFVSASSEGTEYTVSIGRTSPDFSVAVRTGTVLCSPRQGRWRPVRLQPGQRLAGRGFDTPGTDQLDAREQEAEFGWVPTAAPSPLPEFRLRFPRRRPDRPPRSDPAPPYQTPPRDPATPPRTPPSAPTAPSSPPGSRGGIIERVDPSRVIKPSEPVIR